MLLSELMEELEAFCPRSLAMGWDNVGLQAGRTGKEVRRVYLALDADSRVIENALALECDLVLTHHPLLFHGIKQITDTDFIGRRLIRLLQTDTALFAMHTNFDVAVMADEAADRLGLEDREVLEVTGADAESEWGIGRVGALEGAMPLRDLAERVREAFRIPHVRFYGDPCLPVRICAILPGSGKDEIDLAMKAGADVMVTGDITHHVGIDAVEKGIAVIDAGHYGVEKIFVPYMKEYLEKEFPGLEVFTEGEREPFTEV